MIHRLVSLVMNATRNWQNYSITLRIFLSSIFFSELDWWQMQFLNDVYTGNRLMLPAGTKYRSKSGEMRLCTMFEYLNHTSIVTINCKVSITSNSLLCDPMKPSLYTKDKLLEINYFRITSLCQIKLCLIFKFTIIIFLLLINDCSIYRQFIE